MHFHGYGDYVWGRRIHKSNRPWVTYKNWKNSWQTEAKKEELQTLTSSLNTKEAHSSRKTASCCFYEKFWVTGNTITV
jgi:hypothetical protein